MTLPIIKTHPFYFLCYCGTVGDYGRRWFESIRIKSDVTPIVPSSSARDECVPGRKTFSDATVSGHYFFFIFLSIFCFCLDISFVQAVALCGCTFYLLLLWRYINKYLIQKRWEERERPLSFASGIVWRRAKLIDLIWCHLGVRSGRQRMKNGGQSIDFQLGQLLFLYRFPSKKDIRQMVKHFGIMHVSFIWFRWGANNWFRRSSNHFFFICFIFIFFLYVFSFYHSASGFWMECRILLAKPLLLFLLSFASDVECTFFHLH